MSESATETVLREILSELRALRGDLEARLDALEQSGAARGEESARASERLLTTLRELQSPPLEI